MLRLKYYIRLWFKFQFKLRYCVLSPLLNCLVFPDLVVVRVECLVDIPDKKTGLIPDL